jgi:hypothetical protein
VHGVRSTNCTRQHCATFNPAATINPHQQLRPEVRSRDVKSKHPQLHAHRIIRQINGNAGKLLMVLLQRGFPLPSPLFDRLGEG